MKKNTIKIPNELDDDLRPHYDVDYSKTRPNPYAGRVKFTHGGARNGAGRRRAPEPIERHTISLYRSHAKRLRALDSNLSLAIRKLIERVA
jgi:hypothetical protein